MWLAVVILARVWRGGLVNLHLASGWPVRCQIKLTGELCFTRQRRGLWLMLREVSTWVCQDSFVNLWWIRSSEPGPWPKDEWCSFCQVVENRYVTFAENGVNLGLHRQFARLMRVVRSSFCGWQWSYWPRFGEVALSTCIWHLGGQSDAKPS